MENLGYIGFDANLKRILEEVVNQFSQRYTGDKLQQEFYQLQQEKGEKIQVFSSRLDIIYKHFSDKLPEWFSEHQLKDCLFYGVNQSLQDSSRYLYKDEKVTYQVLLAAMEEMKSEYGDIKSTARSKSATM